MKKYRYLIFLFAFISTPSYGWYCETVASERDHNEIKACGIGTSTDEDDARKIALKNAYKEIDLICSKSIDCADRALIIDPMRSECRKEDSGTFKCHRGFRAIITNKKREASQKLVSEDVFIPKNIVVLDSSQKLLSTSIVSFETTPSGASVYLDGVEVCSTPCRKEVLYGEHKVLFDKKDYDVKSHVVNIKSKNFNLKDELISSYGYLTISDLPPHAIIKINNKEIEYKNDLKLYPNEYVVSIESKYHHPWHKKFPLKKGESKHIKFDGEALNAFIKVSVTDEKGLPVSADIYINDKIAGKSPEILKVKAGNNKIKISYPKYKDITFNEVLEANQEIAVNKGLKLSHEKDWFLNLGILLTFSEPLKDIKLNDDKSCCVGFEAKLTYMLTKKIGLSLGHEYITTSEDKNKSTSYYSNLEPSTQYTFINDISESNYVFLVPIYILRKEKITFSLAPEYGISTVTIKKKVGQSTNWGTINSSNLEEREDKVKSNFMGMQFGLQFLAATSNKTDYGFYLGLGARKYKPKDNQYEGKIRGNFNIGFALGF